MKSSDIVVVVLEKIKIYFCCANFNIKIICEKCIIYINIGNVINLLTFSKFRINTAMYSFKKELYCRRILTILLFIYFTCPIFSQTYSLTGIVTDGDNKSLPYANVTLLSDDSITVDGIAADDRGKFKIENVKLGDYKISIRFLGFDPYESNIKIDSDLDLGNILLKESSVQLGTVIVQGTRPQITRKLDRYILSLEHTYVGGKNTLEILQFAPGLSFDRDDILLNRQKAIVIVDNRQLKLSGDQLSDYLKNIDSQTIENIEIIPSPTANTEAEGAGGVIRINLKKGADRGSGLYVNSSFDQGIYPATNQSVGFNYSINQLTLYGNYSYNFSYPYLKQTTINRVDDSEWNSVYDAKSIQYRNAHTYRFGLDYELNKKNHVSIVVDGNEANTSNHISYGNTDVYTKNQLDTIVKGIFPVTSKSYNFGVNLNYIITMGEIEGIKHEIKIIGDYYDTKTNSSNSYKSSYYTLDDLDIPLQILNKKSANENRIIIRSMQTDYIRPFSKTNRMELGAKLSNVHSENNYIFYIKPSDVSVFDMNQKNKFAYTENIAAFYAVYKGKTGKLEYSLGLRGENTNYTMHSLNVVDNSDFRSKNNYFQFFPSIFSSYEINEKNKIIFNYNRRIWRPQYRILNPFKYLINDYMVKSGNPDLTPSYSNNIELTYSLKERYYFTLRYRHQNNEIGEYYFRDINTNITTLSYKNLATSQAYTLSIFAPFTLTNWWKIDNYMEFEFSEYKEPDFNVTSFPFDYTLNQYFNLRNNLNIELNFHFSPQGATYLYTKYTTTTYNLGFSINKSFFKRKLDARIFVYDMLNRSGKFEALDKYAGQYIYNYVDKDKRRLGISLRYNINWGKKIQNFKNERSNSEEVGRK